MDEDKKNPGFLDKIKQTIDLGLDQVILKAQSKIAQESEENLLYRKSIYKDPSYVMGSQGFQEKTARLSYQFLKHMAYRDTIIGTIIQTRQNQVVNFSRPVDGKCEKGFKIILKNEEEEIEKIKEELFGSKEKRREATENVDDLSDEAASADRDESKELSDREMHRKAKELLKERTHKEVKRIQDLVYFCGQQNDRPFESKRWIFPSYLRAIVRDSLTYDQFATEFIQTEGGKLHYWVPVDGGTIRYSTPELKNYKNFPLQNSGYDILYPEKELEALQESDALELDETKLQDDKYKYVQVVRGRIARAFTEAELSVGMRNPTTDLYANGYSIAELELLLKIVETHISGEEYNRLFFRNGFSAKGVIHVQANVSRRKLDMLRKQWRHMVQGTRNSFQTPIWAGMNKVEWIPLTQRHSDMEFSNWFNYLIKIMCGIFQIDPMEIGFGMKEEGGKSGGLGGDNTKEKLDQSKDKGLKPLLKYLEFYINTHIMDKVTDKYKFEFVGIEQESEQEALDRQDKEVKFKKSVNEIREEDGLQPIPGCDEVILDDKYMQWYTQFHPEGRKLAEENRQNMLEDQLVTDAANNQGNEGGSEAEEVPSEVANLKEPENKSLLKKARRPIKPIKIEYYKFTKE